MNALSNPKIGLINQHLVALATYLEDDTFLPLFSQDNYATSLNLNSFIDIAYFLVKAINSDSCKKLEWPVFCKKSKHNFVQQFHSVLDDCQAACAALNLKIVKLQKSHLLDPRPENSKVISFIHELTTAAIRLVVSRNGGDLSKTSDEVKKNIATIATQIADSKLKVDKVKEEIETSKLVMADFPARLSSLKQAFVDSGLVASIDQANLQDLMAVKIRMEAELLEKIVILQSISKT